MQIVPSRVPALLVLLLAGVVPACATDGSFDFKKALAIVSPDYREELADQKDKADEKGKKEAEESKKAEAEVNEKVAAEQAATNAAAADRAAVDPDKAGKIFFTQQPTGIFIRGRGLEKTDGEVYIDEYELGQPLYARAFYFGYDENKAHISIRYTIDGEVFAEEDIREFWDTGVVLHDQIREPRCGGARGRIRRPQHGQSPRRRSSTRCSWRRTSGSVQLVVEDRGGKHPLQGEKGVRDCDEGGVVVPPAP